MIIALVVIRYNIRKYSDKLSFSRYIQSATLLFFPFFSNFVPFLFLTSVPFRRNRSPERITAEFNTISISQGIESSFFIAFCRCDRRRLSMLTNNWPIDPSRAPSRRRSLRKSESFEQLFPLFIHAVRKRLIYNVDALKLVPEICRSRPTRDRVRTYP